MNPIVINGTVLCDPITAFRALCMKLVTRLDPLLEGTGLDVRLCYRTMPPAAPARTEKHQNCSAQGH